MSLGRATCFAILSLLMGQALSDAPRIDFHTTIRPAENLISVTGEETLPSSRVAVSKLSFQLGAQMRNVRFEVVSPASAAGELQPKMVGDNGSGSGNWTADLKSPVAPGVPVTVRFSYDGGDKTAFVFHIGPDGSYSDGSDFAWYPEFGPSHETNGKFEVDGKAEAVGSAVYEFPRDLQLIATGAAGALTTSGDRSRVVYKTHQPSALGFVVDRYRVVRSAGKVPVSLYLKSDLGGDAPFLRGIRQVVDELTSIYGKFPFPSFSLVELSDKEVEGAGFGGAGCAGFMMSTTSYLDQGFNYAFFGHEIGHQWWGNEVTHASEPDGNDLLDEAMAQYGSLYCVDHLLGSQAAERYRKTGYPGYPSSQCGYEYLSMHLAGLDHELQDMPSGPLAHELACEKGFFVFDQLRRVLGDATFHAGLKAVTRDDAFQSVTLAQFEREIERAAHRKLDWFWSQWLKRTGAPILSVHWEQRGRKVVGTLDQEKPYYRIQVPLAMSLSDGSVSVSTVPADGPSTVFALPAGGRVSGVEIDPHFELLHYTPELMERAQAMAPVAKVTWAVVSGSPDFGKVLAQAIASDPGSDPYGADFMLRYFNGRQLLLAGDPAKAVDELESALASPSRLEPQLPMCYLLLMRAEDGLKQLDRARSAAWNAILCEKTLRQQTLVTRSAQAWLTAHPAGASTSVSPARPPR